jgi:hypothetical protein
MDTAGENAQAAAEADFQRELTARRKDLQRDFDEKMRDLKAQHKRQMDRLEQDRIEWEEYRRGKLKELADREERLRRRDENAVRQVEVKESTHKDVVALKERIQELEQEKLKAGVARTALEDRKAKAEEAFRSVRAILLVFAIASLAGTAAWLIVALESDRGSLVWAGASLLVAVLLNVWRLRILAKAR